MFSLEHSNLFFAVIVILPFYLLSALRFRNSGITIASLLRLISLLLLATILAAPALTKYISKNQWTALIDISDSMQKETARAQLEKLDAIKGKTDLSIVPFGGNAGTPDSFIKDIESIRRINPGVITKSTDISGALLSLAHLKSGNLLLVTDGFSSVGSNEQIINTAKKLGLKIFPIIPDNSESLQKKLKITQIDAPLFVAAQKNAEIRVSILNEFPKSQTGKLVIRQGTRTIYEADQEIESNKEKIIIAKSDANLEGIQELTAIFTPQDSLLPESSVKAFLTTEETEKILILSGDSSDQVLFKQIFKDSSYRTDMLLPSELSKMLEASKYSAIILNNIAYKDLSKSLQEGIKPYVLNGGGLIMIGGNRSFGLGGYIDTTIESVLPVQLVPPQTVLKRLNFAIQLVLDKSRSMAEGDRIFFAREAAKEVVRNLKDDDYLGVIGFDSNPFVVQKIEQLSIIRDTVLDRIDRLFPARRTNLLPAIDEARRGLERIKAGRKHMIILTDGKIPDASPLYIELVQQLKTVGITVSTVLLSDENEERLLEEMARRGGGSFYQTSDPSSLPRIFLKDIKVSTGEKTIQEASNFPVRKGSGKLTSTSLNTFLPLLGYVETKPRDNANLELVVIADDKSPPLLASAVYEKGKSIAFTSDANGRWSRNWAENANFKTFWENIIESVRNQNEDGGKGSKISFDLKHYIENGELFLDLTVFEPNNLQSITGILKSPASENINCNFTAKNRGHYICSTSQLMTGRYDLNIKIDNKNLPSTAIYLSPEMFGEKKGLGINKPFLEELASVTGGKINPDKKILDHISSNTTITKTDLRPWLFLLTAIVFFAEILARKKL